MELNIQRGDLVVCVLSGNYGKPRPALVMQSNLFNPTHASITVCPITSHLVDASLFRLQLPPTEQNGLQKTSQIMIDKIVSLPREKITQKIGAVAVEQLEAVNHALKTWLDIDES